MRQRRIVITGSGMVSALGWSTGEAWNALELGQSGLRPLTLFPSPRNGHVLVGQVEGDCSERSGLRSGSRSDHMAVFAARQAFAGAGVESLPTVQRASVGVAVGACTGGMIDTESFADDYVAGRQPQLRLLHHHECASPANAVARTLGLGGFRATVSTACASGATAIAVACDAIVSGIADRMLAGGVDSLTRLTLNGFCSLLNVDPEGCKPFDAERCGMSLGEGAAFLLLENEENALDRQADILAVVEGYGNACDAYHNTAPCPEGSGIHRAMCQALSSAQMLPHDINYINAHGTGTRENDAAEGAAIGRLFEDCIPEVSSTKRFFGHALAAAGAIELAVCVEALCRQVLPMNLGLQTPDPTLPFTPVRQTSRRTLRTALSNSLGFGGNNCSIIISRYQGGRSGR